MRPIGWRCELQFVQMSISLYLKIKNIINTFKKICVKVYFEYNYGKVWLDRMVACASFLLSIIYSMRSTKIVASERILQVLAGGTYINTLTSVTLSLSGAISCWCISRATYSARRCVSNRASDRAQLLFS